MRGGYYRIVGKYGISKFQHRLVLLFCRNIMNYSKRTPMTQYSKKRPLVLVVPFSTDQSVLCGLQEFLQVSFQLLKLTNTHVI